MSADSESADEPADSLNLLFSRPTNRDGYSLHELVAACPPLDPNSVYCNLLQCHHFSATSVKVEAVDVQGNAELVGFVSGYRPPERSGVLFVWQVAVSSKARGMNLGVRMIRSILERNSSSGIDKVHTTITPDNAASWGLFKKLARELGCDYQDEVLFRREDHFGGQHDDEVLMTIGPFEDQSQVARSDAKAVSST